ncbi:22166_t:CDS:2, partial [Cetraspora pellucida]
MTRLKKKTETDTKEIIKINPKEIIDVNQEIGERNHAKQIHKEIVEKHPTGSYYKACQSARLKNKCKTQKLINETFLKLDKELNNIHSVNKFTNIKAYNNAINFEAFNYQQILKMINNLKSNLKSKDIIGARSMNLFLDINFWKQFH